MAQIQYYKLKAKLPTELEVRKMLGDPVISLMEAIIENIETAINEYQELSTNIEDLVNDLCCYAPDMEDKDPTLVAQAIRELDIMEEIKRVQLFQQEPKLPSERK